MRPGRRLLARVRLTDARGNPVCARVRPPAITWSARPLALGGNDFRIDAKRRVIRCQYVLGGSSIAELFFQNAEPSLIRILSANFSVITERLSE